MAGERDGCQISNKGRDRERARDSAMMDGGNAGGQVLVTRKG